ncbi:MAG TPA: LCP family protein [Streptosporangiaceae bacterium]|nr:LCP family protein [Streptosporangiaceae bacterium]
MPHRANRALSGARARWRQQSTAAKFGYILATMVAVVAVVAGLGAFAVYRNLDDFTRVKVGDLTGRTVYGAQNFLVLGSQERLGQHGNFGHEVDPGTTNSDNLLLIHLDPTHTHAIVLSIPRDLFVYEPACKERKYIGLGTWPVQAYPPGAIIDGALNIGGPTCAVATVEDLTGIKLDHFVEFDFNSFRAMVDTIGGVEVCVPRGRGYHDHFSHLNLSPGRHLLKYDQALAYVRTRHGVGSGADAGGDLPRIQLQQAFISSVVQKVQSEGLLSNLGQLYSIAKTATKALTVDDGLGSVSASVHLAESLTHLSSRDVSLITLPTTVDTYPGLQEHLMAVQPQDDVLFQLVRTGQIWHGHLPVQPYDKVQVRVLNGTGQTGLARKTATKLRDLGFDVTGVGNAAATGTTTVDYAGLNQADGAYTLMTALKSFPAGQNTLAEPAWQVGTAGPVTLTLGTDFAGVDRPAPAVKEATAHKPGNGKGQDSSQGGGATPAVSGAIQNGPGAVQSRNAGASICSGLPRAFTPGA